jgi:hypothetical protein
MEAGSHGKFQNIVRNVDVSLRIDSSVRLTEMHCIH